MEQYREQRDPREVVLTWRGQPEEVVEEFLSGLCSSRALLVALVERVELTEQRRLILRFRCAKPGHIS